MEKVKNEKAFDLETDPESLALGVSLKYWGTIPHSGDLWSEDFRKGVKELLMAYSAVPCYPFILYLLKGGLIPNTKSK